MEKDLYAKSSKRSAGVEYQEKKKCRRRTGQKVGKEDLETKSWIIRAV